MRARKSRCEPRPDRKALASSEATETCKLHWRSLDVERKLAIMRFDDTQIVESVIAAQQELSRSDLQCYMLGLRGQDSTPGKVGMRQFAVESDEEGRRKEFVAKQEFVVREDLFEYMEAELGTSFLKGRPLLPRQRWSTVFAKVPKSWGEFLRQVLVLVELAIYEASAQETDKNSSAPRVQTLAEIDRVDSKLDEALLIALEGATGSPSDETTSKWSKRRARKKNQAAQNAKIDEEEGSTLADSVADDSVVPDSTWDHSSASAPTQFQSGGATGSNADDDAVSVLTMATSDGTAFVPRPVEETELQVDWSATRQPDQSPPLETLQESVELEVDWNEGAGELEEARWTVEMRDGFTGVWAEWHWTTAPRPMLTCGNLRAHIKNTFVDDIYDSNDELPEELRRAKSAPAPRRRKRSI